MSEPPQRIELSLVSHTNAGKTTLARTLLGQDIGEVRDEPHVTAFAEVHTLIETPEGDAIRLWDTPGFGDSVRLARRLEQSGNPVGRLFSSTWDRFRDRPFWSSQQAAKNVRDHADVVLYLVNAAEMPSDAGYVGPEMRILTWIGKPALVLLNQTGVPRPRQEEEAEEARWRAHVAQYDVVRSVLTLDAFARCWVQEITLLRAVAEVLPALKRPAFERLQAAWMGKRLGQFEAALEVLAAQLARAACDREVVDEAG
ncbi:MAG: GTPase, partial [Burkholderiales bacterium]